MIEFSPYFPHIPRHVRVLILFSTLYEIRDHLSLTTRGENLSSLFSFFFLLPFGQNQVSRVHFRKKKKKEIGI